MVLLCFPLLLIEEISFKPENFPDVRYEVGIKVNSPPPRNGYLVVQHRLNELIMFL